MNVRVKACDVRLSTNLVEVILLMFRRFFLSSTNIVLRKDEKTGLQQKAEKIDIHIHFFV